PDSSSTHEDLNNHPSVNNLHLLVQSIPVSPLPARAKIFSNSSAPASNETSPVTEEDNLKASTPAKRRRLSLDTEKATTEHPHSEGKDNKQHHYQAPLTAPLREVEPYMYPPRTSQVHGQNPHASTGSSLRPTSSGPVGSGNTKGTHGMINKLQQSMRVKEQQQALIEARLVSPPAGAQQNQSLPEVVQHQHQPQQQQQHHATQQPYLQPITPYPQSHTSQLHHKPSSTSTNNSQPVSHSSNGRLQAMQNPPRQPFQHHQQVPRPIAQHPTPLARLNMPKHNAYQAGSEGGSLHTADPSNQSRTEFPHTGPATAGPTFHASSKLPSFPPPSPSAQSHHPSYPAPQQPATANASGSSTNLPSISPQGSGSANRRAFVALFENVYDTASEDLPKLVATLKDQMRKSSSLLQTLQASGQMIEGLVRSCFRDMQLQYGEKFGAALQDLNRRLEVLEGKLNTDPSGGAVEPSIPNYAAGGSSVGGSGSNGLPPPSRQEFVNNGFRGEPMTPGVKHAAAAIESTEMNALLKSLLDRLEALEKK
ncbi:hypothetical protein HDU78_009747, partial [Chytriomyces hyalinus]